MAKIADFRIQSSSDPDNPVSNVIGVFANASGVLTSLTSAGVKAELGTAFTPDSLVTGALSQATVTGKSSFAENGGTGAAITGFVGGSGFFCGKPDAWLKVSASGSTDFLIPIYKSI